MRVRPLILWTVTLLVLIGAPVGYYNFILDGENKPFCHTQVMLAIVSWMGANKMD